MYRITKPILRFPKTSLALLLLATALVASAIPRTQYDTSIQSFIMENDADYAFYNRYRKTFGQDDVIVVAFEAEDIFALENLALIRKLTARFEDIDNVFDVRSLTNAEYMRGTEDAFEAVPLIREGEESARARAASRAVAEHDHLFQKDLMSLDGRKTAIFVTLLAVDDPAYIYKKEIEEIERIVREESFRTGTVLHVIGERHLDYRFLKYIHRDLKVFLPLTYILLGTFLFLTLRNVRYTVIAFITVSICLTWIAGLIPLMGKEMNSINAGLPSLIMCIAVTDVVHIIHRYRKMRKRIRDSRRAMEAALKEVTLPCFLTSLTTAIGFGSLISNKVHPIKGFGLLASLGVSVCFFVCIIMVPCLILLWREGRESDLSVAEFVPVRVMTGLSRLLTRRQKPVITVVLVILAMSLAGMAILRVEADRRRYLKGSSDVCRALDFIDQNLVGTTQLDIWLETGREGLLKEPAVLQKVEGLAGFLREQPEIRDHGKVLCINDFLKAMNKAFHEDDPGCYVLPDSREEIAQFLLMYSMSGKKSELNNYVDYPYSRTRISVRTSVRNSSSVYDLIERMNGYLGNHFESPLVARVASVQIVYHNVAAYILKGLVMGLGVALLLIGVVMCVSFRSVYVGLVSMIPNVVPIAICLGLMGWLGVYLEMATAMTFSIALGIAVDDTIHLLSRFQLELARTGDYPVAMRQTMENVGSALVETTTIIVAGFLVLLFASLKMSIVFGLLCAFIMVVTLFADLIITPLCVMLFRPFRRGPHFERVHRE